MIDPECHYGDHLWRGTGACVRCGLQLRCYCGQFVTEENLDKHITTSCPLTVAFRKEERRSIEQTFAP